MKLRLLAPLAGIVAAAFPAGAIAAPVLNPLKPCYVSVGVDKVSGEQITEDVEVSGSGFTPNSTVDVAVDGVTAASGVAIDGAGMLPRGTVKAPLQEKRDRDFQVTVTEQGNAAQTVTATAKVSALAVSVKPARARPSSRITFRGRGFTDLTKPVFAHYVKGRKHRKTVKLGVPASPCGIFQAKRRQFPFNPSTGTWLLQIDQQKRYSAKPATAFVKLEIFVRRVLKLRGR